MYSNITIANKKFEEARLRGWEERVDVMDMFTINANSSIPQTETNKYKRFIGYLKEWTSNVMSGNTEKTPDFLGVSDKTIICNAFADKKVPDNWWDIAMKVGKGEEVENTIPKLDHNLSKDIVCAALMPAYRAVRESFEKRWGFLSWIFNHDQYVAERDATRALAGLMRSLTGESPEELEKRYTNYKENITNGGATNSDRRKYASAFRKAKKQQLKALKAEEKTKKDEVVEEDYESQLDDDYLYDEDVPYYNDVKEQMSVDINEEKSVDIQPKIEEDESVMNRSIDSVNSDF